MKKFEKKDYTNIILLILFILMYVLLITNFFEYLYGSTVDWDCQHWAIPDYFRKLFYSTGNLFSEFAFNIGNGQNIFYLSYYGLFSPIIMLSYLFPFIEMSTYIQLISIIGVIASSILLYKWVLNKYNSRIAMLSAFSFITLVPILFHSHRHIMFTNYMPFLLMALIGVDKYFDEGKKCLLIISVFLIVMTSYFFSVSSIFLIVLYGISKFYEKNKKVTFSSFCKEGTKFALSLLLGIMMSMIIILPTFYVILQGRVESNVSVNFFELFLPTINVGKLFYGAYSPGVTALSFIAIIYGIISKKKLSKLLSIFISAFFLFPIFSYILNGTMYVDYKVFIPFTPILILLIANFLNDYENDKLNNKKVLLISFFAGIIIFYLNRKSSISYIFFAELLILLTLVMNRNNIKNYKIISLLLVLITASLSIVISFSTDKLYKKEDLVELEKSDEQYFDSVFEEDNSIYRITNQNDLLHNINRIPSLNYYVGNIYSSTSNNNYNNFYYSNSGSEITQRSYRKITGSMNIFYNLYNANKYFIPDDYLPIGYEKVDNTDNLYKNSDVLPIIYATDSIMSQEEYNKLDFPYNMEALLKNVIVDDSFFTTIFNSEIEKADINIEVLNNQDNLTLRKNNNNYNVSVDKTSEIDFFVDGLVENEILIIKFDLANNQSCSVGDLEITINGIKNVLTCKSWKYHNKNTEFHYVISSNSAIDELNVIFSKGNYEISNLEFYKVNYSTLKEVRENVDEFYFNKEKTTDNKIVGTIDVSNDGYMFLSIPYDEGFSIYLNGEHTDYDMVDEGFIGIKVNKGFYDVEIEYNSPFFKEGKIVSLIGIIIYIYIVLLERRKRKKGIAQK